ncbi:hypothetical protein [Pseudomonas sp. AN-1]|uniref:hypothetical protein n=1 Tax=Pseudomonas sp. AN-1 TaxID=3096605 RepID=UPI002A6AC120|nr:hypothetical protein [Pseudomonas sp. AN-1]WPP46619.1 hypothetical protein SK095_04300 [Pseudomonas sp. AN-1]
MATTKQRVSDEQRRQVLDLRRKHSLREVAEATGLPLGTVKTIVSRSGAFRDNAQHRALFTLPPVREAAETLPAEAPELPPQEVVTGDRELDAVLWLRGVITTGNAAMIAKALEAAKRIKTPADTLEKRYAQYLATTTAHPCKPSSGRSGSRTWRRWPARRSSSAPWPPRRKRASARRCSSTRRPRISRSTPWPA